MEARSPAFATLVAPMRGCRLFGSIYPPVGDLEESLRRAVDEGGKVLKAARDDGGDYVYAVIEDLVGVPFGDHPGLRS